MGWLEYSYKVKSPKKELDNLYKSEDNFDVVISRLVKGVYYAAIKNLKTSDIFAVIVLYNNNKIFKYKDMDETCHPYYYDCPVKILESLTNTENNLAIEWRKKCWQNIKNISIENNIGKKIYFKSNNPLYKGVDLTNIEFTIVKEGDQILFEKPDGERVIIINPIEFVIKVQ